MQIKRTRTQGFTLVEIMIVVAIIGLLAAIAIPNFVRARQTSMTNACINNLRQIDGAKQQYCLEKGTPTGAMTQAQIQQYLGRGSSGTWPSCPVTQTDVYSTHIGDAATPPTCGNIDATTHNAVLQ